PELVARISRVSRAIRAGEAVEYRIAAARALLLREGIGHGEGDVVMADDLALAGAQMLDVGVADEAARAAGDVLGKTGDFGDAGIKVARGVALRPGTGQPGQIIGERETLGLRLRLLAEGAFALELGRGQRRQLQSGAERGTTGAESQGALDDRGQHNNA